jgi:spore coat protein U-like protein
MRTSRRSTVAALRDSRLAWLAAGALIAGASLWSGASRAADSTTVAVTATVNANCNMQAASTPVAFSTFNAFSGANATGQVTLQCNRGATVRVDIDNGGNFSGGTRNMASGANLLPYSLFQPDISGGAPGTCGGTTAWGTVAAGLSATSLWTASGGPRAINICGVVPTPSSSGYAVGSYTDTVTVTAVYN